MQRYFNTEGSCDPKKHYMVNLEKRLELIKNRYVERGSYFVINRGRQYGKTTTLKALADYLTTEYIVVSMDFQMLSAKNFEDESMFSKAFARMLYLCSVPGRTLSFVNKQYDRSGSHGA